MNKKLVIMLVGKTHSGKTTLALELKRGLSNTFSIIETDPISLFVKQNYNDLCTDNEHTGDFEKPSLKLIIYKTVIDFAIDRGQNIILGNSNLFKKLRSETLKKFSDAGYKTMILYLNTDEKTLTERINTSDRSRDFLRFSKSYQEVLKRQAKIFDTPDPSESDFFIEINYKYQMTDLLENIKQYL